MLPLAEADVVPAVLAAQTDGRPEVEWSVEHVVAVEQTIAELVVG